MNDEERVFVGFWLATVVGLGTVVLQALLTPHAIALHALGLLR